MYNLKSVHNRNIKRKVIGEILLAHSIKYSEEDVYNVLYYAKWCNFLVAVRRMYESLRRLYLDEEKKRTLKKYMIIKTKLKKYRQRKRWICK